jgi:fused signal recognition particle receptor
MREMQKIVKVAEPDLVLFVGDSLAGNDALTQAKEFNKSIGIDANILTKLDADAKGGAALSISYETKKPIIFVGTGQGYDDLEPFNREIFISNILDISEE